MYIKEIVPAKYNECSLYSFLKEHLNFSNVLIKRLKREGQILREAKLIRTIDNVKTGDLIEIILDEKSFGLEIKPYFNQKNPSENIDIIFQNAFVCAVSKPPKMLSHPSYQNQENSLISKLEIDGNLHCINRLDRDTSGLILLAKSSYAKDFIAKANNLKIYLAFVHQKGWLDGEMTDGKNPELKIMDVPIKRADDSIMLRLCHEEQNHEEKAQSKDKPKENKAQEAITISKTIHSFQKIGISLVAFRLLTGRTHQIRVHSLHNLEPLLGDGLYGLARIVPSELIEADEELKSLIQDKMAQEKDEKINSLALSSWSNYKGRYLLPEKYQGDYFASWAKENFLFTSYQEKENKKALIKKIKSMLQIDKKLKRQALHSYFFECLLPLEKERRSFICPLAKDLRDLINYCVMEEGIKSEIIDEKIFETINILKNYKYEAEPKTRN